MGSNCANACGRKAMRYYLPHLLVAITILGSATNMHAEETKLPDPPEGFIWVSLDNALGAFLQPKDWHVHREQSGDTSAIFITPEEIQPDRMFKTGLTVNVVTGRKDLDAVAYAKALVKEVQRRGETNGVDDIKFDDFVGFACTAKYKDPGGDFTMYVAAIGNSKTNALYVILFESPEKEWDTAWRIGQVIAKKFVLTPNK